MKNKKIIALIAIPVIISCLVLPLCSFTTVKGFDDYIEYSSRMSFDAEYCYHRVTNTINQKYFGTLPNLNRVLIPSSFANVSDITNYASDYYITSDTALKYQSTTSSNHPSSYDFGYGVGNLETPRAIESSVSILSNKPQNAYFTGKFYFDGIYAPFGNISDNSLFDFSIGLIDLNGDLVQPEDLLISVDYTYCQYTEDGLFEPYDESFVIDYQYSITFPEPGEIQDNNGYISIDKIFEYYYLSIGSHPTFDYISSISISFDYYDVDVSSFSGVIIHDLLYNEPDFYINMINNIVKSTYGPIKYEEGYYNGYVQGARDGREESYNQGYGDGVNAAPTYWGSIGSMLSATVGGFLSFEIIPGISLTVLLSAFLGFILVFIFLKLFAGG